MLNEDNNHKNLSTLRYIILERLAISYVQPIGLLKIIYFNLKIVILILKKFYFLLDHSLLNCDSTMV